MPKVGGMKMPYKKDLMKMKSKKLKMKMPKKGKPKKASYG